MENTILKSSKAFNVAISMDLLLAILIVVFSSILLKSPIGRISLAFGFIMMSITGLLIIKDRIK